MISSLGRELLEIARAAAEVIRSIYAQPFAVEFKAIDDPVTLADRQANEVICDRIAAALPGIPVVAEESDPAWYEGFRASDRVFFVDPLDGTRDFVRRSGEFVVMIGLIESARPILGVLVAPATGVAWVGEVGRGAARVDPNGAMRSIRVSPVSAVAEARILVSRSHRTELIDRAAELIGAREVVGLGSAGLKAAWVAEGRADAYLAPGLAGKRWDACAPEALVAAAGGRLSDVEGQPIDYRGASLLNDRGLIAANPALHPRLLAAVAQARGRIASG